MVVTRERFLGSCRLEKCGLRTGRQLEAPQPARRTTTPHGKPFESLAVLKYGGWARQRAGRRPPSPACSSCSHTRRPQPAGAPCLKGGALQDVSHRCAARPPTGGTTCHVPSAMCLSVGHVRPTWHKGTWLEAHHHEAAIVIAVSAVGVLGCGVRVVLMMINLPRTRPGSYPREQVASVHLLSSFTPSATPCPWAAGCVRGSSWAGQCLGRLRLLIFAGGSAPEAMPWRLGEQGDLRKAGQALCGHGPDGYTARRPKHTVVPRSWRLRREAGHWGEASDHPSTRNT